MACTVEIQDIAETWNRVGILPEVPGLDTERVVAILTALRKEVNQSSDVVTSKGVGTYGLQLYDLQLTCMVKNGISTVSSLQEILADPSVFTGKDGVNAIADLLSNENLQAELMAEVMKQNMNTLIDQGVITGNENEASLATVAAVSAKYTPVEVKANIQTQAPDNFDATTDSIFSYSDSAMDLLGLAGKIAMLAAVLRTVDVSGLLKGIGGAVVSLPTLATDTIDQAATNLEANKIVGSKLIPSIGDVTQSAGDAASGLLASATDTLNKGTSKLPLDKL